MLFVKKAPKSLRSGVNLLISRDGETFGFTSLVPDTVKALASFKNKEINIRDSYLNLGTTWLKVQEGTSLSLPQCVLVLQQEWIRRGYVLGLCVYIYIYTHRLILFWSSGGCCHKITTIWMPQLCANKGCPFGWDKPRAIMFVVSCCFRFPSKRMRLGCVLHQHGRVAQVRPWPMLTVGLIFIYLLIPVALVHRTHLQKSVSMWSCISALAWKAVRKTETCPRGLAFGLPPQRWAPCPGAGCPARWRCGQRGALRHLAPLPGSAAVQSPAANFPLTLLSCPRAVSRLCSLPNSQVLSGLVSSWAQQSWEARGGSQCLGSTCEGRVPVGVNVSFLQNEDKKADQGSLEDLSKEKGVDEPDRAQQRSPQPSEPVSIQRRSPLIRNRKTGSMEVSMQWVPLLVLMKVFCLVLVSWHSF